MSHTIRVAVAIILNKSDEVLISLRKNNVHQGGLWEFPGGKVEAEESGLDALKREIHEELNIDISKASPFKVIVHQYPDVKVYLDIWKVETYSGIPQGAEGQEIKWQKINSLDSDCFPMANVPIINALQLPDKFMITGGYKNLKVFSKILETSLKNNISLVQLRSKNLTDTEYKQLIKISKPLCRTYAAKLLLNTHLDMFLDQPTDGLHLSSQMLKSMNSRPITSNLLLSVSCHSREEIAKAIQLKADIILLSPVKETRSHPGVAGIGWEQFRLLSAGVNAPVYALGGMTEKDLGDAKAAGAQGVAAISSFWRAE